MGLIFFIPSCKKESPICKSPLERKKSLKITKDSNNQMGRYYPSSNGTPDLYVFDVEVQDLFGILDTYSLTLGQSTSPIALALLYPGAIDTTDLSSSTPTAIVAYTTIINNGSIGQVWAQMFNNNSNSWSANNNVWGITTMIATNVINDDILTQNLSIQNVVILQTGYVPENPYVSDFESRPIGGGQWGGTKCNSSSNCSQDVEGVCVRVSPNNPRDGYYCKAPAPCASETTRLILSNNQYEVSDQIISDMHNIRNYVLRSSKNRSKYIDDYYYASSIINENIDLTFALSVYDVWQTNLIRKIKNLTNNTYSDTILINFDEKTKLLNLCNVVSQYSGDTRYLQIIDSVESKINRFYSRTNSYVNSNL